MYGNSSVILISELLHEVDECLNSLESHGIVDAGAASSHRSVALELDQAVLASLLKELSLELVVLLDAEGNVHAGAISRVHRVREVVARAVDQVVEELALACGFSLKVREPALLLHVGEVKAGDVDGVASGGVVELGWSVTEDFPVKQEGRIFSHVRGADQVIADHRDANTCRAHVLLGASIDNSVFLPVNWARAKVGGHVTNECLVLGNGVVGEGTCTWELHSVNSLIVAIVEVSSIFIYVPRASVGDCDILGARVGPDFVWLCDFLALLEGSLTPSSSGQVVSSLILTAQQVIGNCAELHGCTALEEEHIVSTLGQAHEVTEVPLGLLSYLNEFL
jgi:hypothetical protein